MNNCAEIFLGAAVARMMEHLMTKKIFGNALTAYLKK